MKYYHFEHYAVEFVVSEHIKTDIPSHNHANHYIISLCLKNSVNVRLDNEALCIAEHDYFVVPPFMPHAVQIPQNAILGSLCINIAFVEKYNQTQCMRIINSLLSKESICHHITNEQKNLFLKAVPYIYELSLTHTKEYEEDIALLRDRLMKSFDNLNLDRLAKELYISKYYLIRKCKRHLGMTPHKFHIQNRIRKSQKMLLTGKTVAEVSVHTGFYDQSHFDKQFHKIVGISPSEYIVSTKSI